MSMFHFQSVIVVYMYDKHCDKGQWSGSLHFIEILVWDGKNFCSSFTCSLYSEYEIICLWTNLYCSPALVRGHQIFQNLMITTCKEKSFCKTLFQLEMGLKKYKNKAEMERMQEDYPTSAKIHRRCWVVFLRSSSLPCFCTFSRPFLNWNEILQKLFSLVSVLFWGFQITLQIEDERIYCAGDEHIENERSNFRYTHTATCSYQRLSNTTYLEMITTHRYSPPKITLSYSPPSTLHPQVTYAKAF